MKPVPDHIIDSGPPGTKWHGGAIDRSKMALRVGDKDRSKSVDKEEIAKLLGSKSDQEKHKHWSLHAPESENGDLESQVHWIFSQLTDDMSVWKMVTSSYRVDLFCGLFMERPNRGVSLSPEVMSDIGGRGIELGFDIYAPEEKPNKPTMPIRSRYESKDPV